MGGKGTKEYEESLRALQIELVKLQADLIRTEARVLVIVEGRDAAGKDGTIKRLTEHMSPRDTRVFAPSKPSDAETKQWYFQRFTPHLPSGGEFVIFNRSWYNRAGVERVMGFATQDEVESFFRTVDDFERLQVRDGLHLRKYYLDIDRDEQKERLEERQNDPLKKWKNSPIDASASKKWDVYTKARDDMFRRTSFKEAPWRVVKADQKKPARLAMLADLIGSFDYKDKDESVLKRNRMLVFPWSKKIHARLAK
jgi:polyphosphate kinase 2